MRLRQTPFSAVDLLRPTASWVFFCGAAALLLQPVLITAIAADDLINPFSQLYHTQNELGQTLSRVRKSVESTGHFNYVGQTVGSLVVLTWSYLIGETRIRYSTVYASTKYLTYLITVLAAAGFVREVLARAGIAIHKWTPRLVLLVALSLTLQIHIPWSNDPVASYPLAGYFTAAIGFLYLKLHLTIDEETTFRRAVGIGMLGIFAVLYYEYNLFVILAILPPALHSIWSVRKERTHFRRLLLLSATTALPGILTALYFYLRNRDASAAYTGTSISLDEEFVGTFTQGLVSSLPGSSWAIALDWLTAPLQISASAFVSIAVGLLIVALVGLLNYRRPIPWTGQGAVFLTIAPLLLGSISVCTYWIGTTFTQTATQKVQDESSRVGHVYNYYAVGSLAVVVLVTILMFWLFNVPALRRLVGILMVSTVFFGSVQWVINWNVMNQFNGAMTGARNLLVAVAEQPPMEDRCVALETWKSMGWPEYYWLDMELGLDSMFKRFRSEPFCEK